MTAPWDDPDCDENEYTGDEKHRIDKLDHHRETMHRHMPDKVGGKRD
jgi:hypothetical protein